MESKRVADAVGCFRLWYQRSLIRKRWHLPCAAGYQTATRQIANCFVETMGQWVVECLSVGAMVAKGRELAQAARADARPTGLDACIGHDFYKAIANLRYNVDGGAVQRSCVTAAFAPNLRYLHAPVK